MGRLKWFREPQVTVRSVGENLVDCKNKKIKIESTCCWEIRSAQSLLFFFFTVVMKSFGTRYSEGDGEGGC